MCHILLIDGREKMKLIIAEKKELAEAIVAAIPGDKNIKVILLLSETT